MPIRAYRGRGGFIRQEIILTGKGLEQTRSDIILCVGTYIYIYMRTRIMFRRAYIPTYVYK